MREIRHAAVWLAAVLFFAVGAVWYTLLAEPWMAGIGKTRDQLMAQGGGPGVSYAVGFAAIVVLCYTLAWLVGRMGAASMAGGMRTGAALGIGLCSATIALNYAFELRPVSLWLINAGFVTLGLALAGAIVGGWRRRTVTLQPRAAGA